MAPARHGPRERRHAHRRDMRGGRMAEVHKDSPHQAKTPSEEAGALSLARSRKCRFQASPMKGCQRTQPSWVSPFRRRRRALCHHGASQRLLWVKAVEWRRSSAMVSSFPWNQLSWGGRKPCLFQRVRIVSGKIPRMDSRKSLFVWASPMRCSGGSERANSASRWSQKGRRTSREWAMELRSP